MYKLDIRTNEREEMIDITAEVSKAIASRGWQNGAVHLFCQHTTCGLTINEGADPNVQKDLMTFFREIAPERHDWRHLEGNSDAHIRSGVLGVSLLAPVRQGGLMLGRWQKIFLYEGDGPRSRTILIQFFNEHDN